MSALPSIGTRSFDIFLLGRVAAELEQRTGFSAWRIDANATVLRVTADVDDLSVVLEQLRAAGFQVGGIVRATAALGGYG